MDTTTDPSRKKINKQPTDYAKTKRYDGAGTVAHTPMLESYHIKYKLT